MEEPLKSPHETARQKALRIPLVYHRARGAVSTWKVLLSAGCVLAAGLYVAWVLAGGKSAATQVSPGTLARDHSRWDNDCKACHVQFMPQRGDADGARLLSLTLGSSISQDVHRQSDAKCSDCHKAAGPHHSNQIAAEVESCASCHRDHRGRDFEMARMDDSHCTVCHASIADHRGPSSSPSTTPMVNVTAFRHSPKDASSGHPPFRSLKQEDDPGNIRFSHRLHMSQGQLYPGQIAPPGKTLEQLTCDACHQPDTTTSKGAYMRPIKYEQHCRRCHPLNVPNQPGTVVPHGLASQQLENAVRAGIAANEQQPVENPPPPRPIPGKSAADKDTAELRLPSELRFAQQLALVRENKCSQCHSWRPENPLEVRPAKIPSTWFQHARFNHQRHVGVAKCLDCHAEAGAKLPAGGGATKLADDQQIMIPDIDNCVRCHAPRNEAAGAGGARFDCAQCHRYHHPPIQENPQRPSDGSSASAAQWPTMLRLTLVDHQPPATSRSQAHPFVGTHSCGTTGCHGAVAKRGSPSAFTRYLADDPHAQAFLLLYTESSRRMVRRLRGDNLGEPSEPEYFAALQDKCLGCHATPPADISQSSNSTGHLAGITCESCHSAAAEWEFTHFQRGSKPSPPALLSEPSARAANCAECHIGPKEILGRDEVYDVNHDLIAAGHPRLTFEFEAQLANLPAHWSAGKDVKSHFEAWRLGELATAAQQDKLHAGRAALEFASHRCFDCHHSLTAKPATGRAAFPPLAVIGKPERQWLVLPATSKQEQAAILLKLLARVTDESAGSSAGTRWEEHVHLSLALSALAADRPQSGDLGKYADALNAMLANSFRSLPRDGKLENAATFPGGPYDSPAGFHPQNERLKTLLENIRASLSSP